ncbi:LamG-like jellyroll fold domain-containing protein [Flagellimonas onchidii]|uniref:LamG-like jellyroll fold domain-containing protein n=1 Tax=Flagellimonas onchidii TaxID=2562684 RepID=UPI0010A6B4D4|nr:LamG-like jellyroll fold domain-containing protein [Allomuricauda onchidii]
MKRTTRFKKKCKCPHIQIKEFCAFVKLWLFGFGFMLFANDAFAQLSRTNRVIAQKGLQLVVWTHDDVQTAGVDPGYPVGSNWTNLNFTAPAAPRYNSTFFSSHPSSPYSIIFAPYGDRMDRSPNTTEITNGPYSTTDPNDPTPGQTSNANILNLINDGKITTMQFGDEEGYSTALVGRWRDWYDVFRNHYPNILVHNNQYVDQWSEGQLRDYLVTAKPDLLTFDNYWWWRTNTNRTGGALPSMGELAKYRKLAMEGYDGTGSSPISFGQYLGAYKPTTGQQASGGCNDAPGYTFSESQIYGNTYSAFVMGGKWSSLFRWVDVTDAAGECTWLFPSQTNGPTPQYWYYSKVAKEINNLSPHLSRLQNRAIYYGQLGQYMNDGAPTNNDRSNLIPDWNSNFDPYITDISGDNLTPATNDNLDGDVFISYFEPIQDIDNTSNVTMAPVHNKNARYFMIFNGMTKPNGCCHHPTDPLYAQDTIQGKANLTRQRITLTMDFGTNPVDQLKRVSTTTGNVENVALTSVSGSVYTTTFDLDGGKAALFYWENQHSIPMAKLVGHWTFDETSGTTAADASGNNRNGTLVGGPTWNSSGRVNGAISLDGTNDWINLTDFNLENAFTISAWVKLNAGINQFDGLMSADDPRTGQDINFYNGAPRLWNGSSDVVISNTSVTANVWTHVAFVRDGSDITIYINGEAKGRRAWTETLTVGALGRSFAGIGFSGLLDDFRIYEGALTSREIKELPGFATTGPDITSNLEGHWTFDETSGTTAIDASGNNRTGTLQGNPTWNASGKVNGAIALDGTGDWVNISDMNLSGDFTIASWVNLSTGIGNQDGIVAADNANNGQDINFYNGAGRLWTGATDVVISNTTMTANTWTHVAITRSGSNLTIYIDGVSTGTGSWSGTMDVGGLGRSFVGAVTEGSLDDLRIYSRALNSNEINALPGFSGASSLKVRISDALELIEEGQNQNDMRIFPNPAKSIFYLTNGKTHEGNATFALFNLSGQQVMQRSIDLKSNATTTFDISRLNKGLYILIGIQNGKEILNKKVVIE